MATTITQSKNSARTSDRMWQFLVLISTILIGLSGCGGGGGGGGGTSSPPPPPSSLTLDQQVSAMITAEGLTGDPAAGRALPSINDPLAQLGKLLFFSKSLSGDMDTACASCHHPALGGGDGLSLPVGTGAVDPDVLGLGRARPDGLPNVGRHSQTVFNAGLWDDAMFWDSRVESIGKEAGQNGAGSGIRTPESPFNAADPLVAIGTTLVAAQARLPVTIPEEMLGEFMPGADGEAIRQRLAERIGDYGAGVGELANNNWLTAFQTAFASAEAAEQLITFDNIALAIGEFQRSMVFVDTPWKAYVEGDLLAISPAAKQGALLFFGDLNPAVACDQCHGGDFFTDERSTITGLPQTGIGKGDGVDGDADFGREQQTGDANDRFAFRTPTLLNLLATAPYNHTGTYDFLESMQHYFLPEMTFDDAFFPDGRVCGIPQFADHPDCSTLFPNTLSLSNAALNAAFMTRTTDPDRTFADFSFSPQSDAPFLFAFIEALTDPCTLDRACLAPWIPLPSEAPDGNQLNAVDINGDPL